MELLTVLTKYLETNKRLVIPQLGAFLVKEAGKSVVFSELMKRDDGVLRGLLCSEGRSEVEAAGMIDRFVFEVRNALENGKEYRLAGFGTMKSGPNDTIVFTYRPAAESIPSSNEQVSSRPQPSESPKPLRDSAPKPVVNPFPQPQPVRVTTNDSPYRSHIDTERMAESVRMAFGNDPDAENVPIKKGSVSVKQHESSYDELDEEDYVETTSGNRKVDRFLLVAILAALIAVAVIAFGFWREARERQAEESMFQMEESFETGLEQME